MPIAKFECPEHGQFSRVVSKKQDTEKCPQCGKWSKKIFSAPKNTAQIEESENRPPVMTDRQISERVAQDSEVAWDSIQERRDAREEASKQLPDEEKARVKEDVEYRGKLEQVIKSEPQENLDKAGYTILRKDNEHAAKMAERNPK